MYHKCIHYVRMIPSQWMYPCNLLFVTCKTFGEELIRRRDLGSLGLSTVPKGFWPLPVGGSGHVECWYTVVRRLKALFKVGIIRGRSERSCTIILHDRYRFSATTSTTPLFLLRISTHNLFIVCNILTSMINLKQSPWTWRFSILRFLLLTMYILENYFGYWLPRKNLGKMLRYKRFIQKQKHSEKICENEARQNKNTNYQL